MMYIANSIARMFHNTERIGALNSAADSSRKMPLNTGNIGGSIKDTSETNGA